MVLLVKYQAQEFCLLHDSQGYQWIEFMPGAILLE